MKNSNTYNNQKGGLSDKESAQTAVPDTAFERKMEMRRKRRWNELIRKLELM